MCLVFLFYYYFIHGIEPVIYLGEQQAPSLNYWNYLEDKFIQTYLVT